MISMFEAICLVAVSCEHENSTISTEYGTGFFIHQSKYNTYVATCAHVVRSAFSCDKKVEVLVNGYSSIVKAHDQDSDVAILQVNQVLPKAIVLPIHSSARKDEQIQVIGMSALGSEREKREMLMLEGALVKESAWSISGGRKIPTWYIRLDDTEFKLRDGFSGAPVISKHEGHVVGIISHKAKSGVSGITVSSIVCNELWHTFSSEALTKTLTQAANMTVVTDFFGKDLETKKNAVLQKEISGKYSHLDVIISKINRLEKRILISGFETEKIDLESQVEQLREIKINLGKDIEELEKKLKIV